MMTFYGVPQELLASLCTPTLTRARTITGTPTSTDLILLFPVRSLLVSLIYAATNMCMVCRKHVHSNLRRAPSADSAASDGQYTVANAPLSAPRSDQSSESRRCYRPVVSFLVLG